MSTPCLLSDHAAVSGSSDHGHAAAAAPDPTTPAAAQKAMKV